MPPLHGVPFTVKENIDLAGSATTQGLVAFEQAVPDVDAPHIAQLRAAGAIPLARTNLPDFGLRWHTDSSLRGATLNPWDASRTPGGSSGGEAAALATGMSPLGMGNDYGGSLRVPAQFCGIASLRTTLGRVPHATAFTPEDFPISLQLMAVQGPMARRVADLRLALRPHVRRGPARSVVDTSAARRPAAWRGGSPCGGAADDPDVAAGVDAAAAARSPTPASRSTTPSRRWWARRHGCGPTWWPPTPACWSAMLRSVFGADALRFIDTFFELQPDLDKAGYVEGLVARQGVARAWSRFQAECPLVLGPVSTRSPIPVGRDLEGPEAGSEILDSMRLVVTVNLLGLPAAAVPVGVAGGLPQGVQLIGPRYREDLCLDAAQAIEDRLGILTPIDPV